MFIGKQTIKGKTYYRLMESFREGVKTKKRILFNLGRYPTLEDALSGAKQHGDDERVNQLEVLIAQCGTKGKGIEGKRGTKIEGDMRSGPECGTNEDGAKGRGTKSALRQLSPKGNLIRRKRLLVERERGPGSGDLLPPPGEGEVWGKRYFKRITFELMERKIKGGDPKEIADILFPHFTHHGQVGLATATLVFALLNKRPDKSIDPERFIDEYRASDYGGIVAQIKRHGTLNGRAILTEANVIEIRRQHKEGKTLKVLAETFGVGVECVWKVISRRTWKSI